MIKEILVCLEASPSSEMAARLAIEIARDRGATLVGLAIVDEPDIRAGAATGIGGASFKHERDEALVADARKQAADWLAMFDRRCRSANVPASTLEIVGRPVESILAETEKRDLTVMGRDANFRFETEREDPQTREAILHRATRPLVLVPEDGDRTLGKKIVVAYDGSAAAKRAIESFAKSGLAEGRDVLVATVDDHGERAFDLASRAVAMLGDLDVAATPHNIVSTLANIDALMKFATDAGAAMIVMGSFAHSRLKQLFRGSVTRGLVEKTTIPLYLQP
jgi:nucleotide-binding universal stress UspA family protein